MVVKLLVQVAVNKDVWALVRGLVCMSVIRPVVLHVIPHVQEHVAMDAKGLAQDRLLRPVESVIVAAQLLVKRDVLEGVKRVVLVVAALVKVRVRADVLQGVQAHVKDLVTALVMDVLEPVMEPVMVHVKDAKGLAQERVVVPVDLIVYLVRVRVWVLVQAHV